VWRLQPPAAAAAGWPKEDDDLARAGIRPKRPSGPEAKWAGRIKIGKRKMDNRWTAMTNGPNLAWAARGK
jgi:hypothetical protein